MLVAQCTVEENDQDHSFVIRLLAIDGDGVLIERRQRIVNGNPSQAVGTASSELSRLAATLRNVEK